MANADGHKMDYLLPENKLGRKLEHTSKGSWDCCCQSCAQAKCVIFADMFTDDIFYLSRFFFTFAYGVPLYFTVLFLSKKNHSLVLSLKKIYSL